ncbi:MAG: ABC transporter ATP-binding protein [Bacillota bacterium]
MAESGYAVDVQNLTKCFPVRQGFFRSRQKGSVLKAVNGVSFKLKRGESLGLAGESGCGKTTTGKILLKLYEPTSGKYLFNGKDVTNIKNGQELKEFRKRAQLVFQNPFEALNPRFTVFRSIAEPLIIHNIGSKDERVDLVKQALERVHLQPAETFLDKYPHQMSGGQLQRVVLARALVVDPVFVVADEPVSMLDVSVRAGVLNLMKEVAQDMQLTAVYISHDLSLIRYLCDYTAIMYLGQIVEIGLTGKVLEKPEHPYTQALISAVPVPDPDFEGGEVKIGSHVPSPIDLPPGCLFQDRCPYVEPICRQVQPTLQEAEPGHSVRCHMVNGIASSLKGGGMPDEDRIRCTWNHG